MRNTNDVTINSYNIICYENIDLFYDEIEINLFGNSSDSSERFIKNLDLIKEIFIGNIGILKFHDENTIYHIHLKKSKSLNLHVKQLIGECNEYNIENKIKIRIMFE
jgi:hypothetical protein